MEEKFWHEEEEEAGKNSLFPTRRSLNSSSRIQSFAAFDLARLKGKTTFGAQEKLKSQKIIEQLFDEGKSVAKNGFTLVYLSATLNTNFPAQAGFSVPKKSFKHAVDRNRVKRLMREAYRHAKYSLYERLVAEKWQLALMWVYKGKALPEYEATCEAMQHCLKKLPV